MTDRLPLGTTDQGHQTRRLGAAGGVLDVAQSGLAARDAYQAFRAGDTVRGGVNSAQAVTSAAQAASTFAARTSVLARAAPGISVAGTTASLAGSANRFGTALGGNDQFDKWATGTELALRSSAATAGYAFGGPVGSSLAVGTYDLSSAVGRPIGAWLGNRLSDNSAFQRATDRWFGLQTNADRAAMYDQQIAAIRAARAQANR